MRRTTISGLLLAVAMGGCASPPSPIDLTPRFVTGESRVENLQTYAAVRTAVADVVAHVGFSWRAVVKGVGPEGATIKAQVTRVVVKLPGLPAFDTNGSLLTQMLGVGELLFRLLEARFEYVVGPTGHVTVSGWRSALEAAAARARCEVPGDGSVPTEGMLGEALSRVYGGALPRRPVSVDERWTAGGSYHVGTPEQGSKVQASDTMVYEGFGELEVPFGEGDVKVEGLGVPIEGAPAVARAGESFMGKVDVQTGRSGGYLCVAPTGDEVLGYWQKDELEVTPRDGLLPVGGDLLGAVTSALAHLERGWAFFASSPWR